MTHGNLTKEFHKLLKNIRKLSEGQAEIVEWDDEDVSNFKLDLKPHGGAYKGGTFRFTVTLGETFPETAPVIRCETHIYHPNIDPTEEYDDTNICLNMFNSDEWQEVYGMDGLVQGLLFLFYEPNLEDPLSPYFDSSSEIDFEMNVLASLKGEMVEGVQYNWNYGEKETVEEKDVDQDPSIIKGDNSKSNMADKTEDIEKGDNSNVVDQDPSIIKGDNSKSNMADKTEDIEKGDNSNVVDQDPSIIKGDNSKSNMVDKTEDIEKGDNSNVDDVVILREKRQVIDPDIIRHRRRGGIFINSELQCNIVSSDDGDDENLFPQQCDLMKANVVKTKELTITSNVLPDFPEVVTMEPGHSDLHQPLVDMKDLDLSVQCEAFAGMSEVNLSRKCVSLSSFDPAVPEMNLLFLMINKLSELFESCPRTCKK